MSAQTWFFGFEILSGFATLLVIVGLFKEYGLDVLKAFQFWGMRETHAHVEIETASKRQGSALVVIGIMLELIGTVGIVGTSLRIETQHRGEIATLNERTSLVYKSAADANQKAEKLKAANLKLQRAVGPREIAFFQGARGTLEGAACSAAVPLLAEFRGLQVFVQFDNTDRETRNFAKRFLNLAESAGWQPQILQPTQTGIEPDQIKDGLAAFTWMGAIGHMGRKPPILPSPTSPEDLKAEDAVSQLGKFLIFSDIFLYPQNLIPDRPERMMRQYPSFRFDLPHGALLVLIGEKETTEELVVLLGIMDDEKSDLVAFSKRDPEFPKCRSLSIGGIPLTNSPSVPVRVIP